MNNCENCHYCLIIPGKGFHCQHTESSTSIEEPIDFIYIDYPQDCDYWKKKITPLEKLARRLNEATE